jgi:hypothetical protein
MSNFSKLVRVRGWTGKISGNSIEISLNARAMRVIISAQSTLQAGSVITPYRPSFKCNVFSVLVGKQKIDAG